MRPSFTVKLLLVLLLTNAILVGGMTLATHWSFQKGFLHYLTRVELKRLEPMGEALSHAYAAHGSWAFLHDNRHAWRRFFTYLPEDMRPRQATQRRPPPPRDGASGRTPPPPPPPQPDNAELRRIGVLDAGGGHVFGAPSIMRNDAIRKPLQVDGRTIGYLVLAPLPWPAASLDRSFRNSQLLAIYWIAGGALLLALLMALPAARQLLAPIKAIARGARELAAGRYGTRIEPHSRDEIGRLAGDFNALAHALERNEGLRRQHMADVSHELRTPISLLQAEIEAIQDGVRPCSPERLQALHNATARLSGLVGDLYDLTLSDAGALDYRKEPVGLEELAEEAVEAARPAATERTLELTLESTEPLPLFADPGRLRQVLDNLLKNSLRYTDPGGRIVVRAKRHGAHATLEVEDSAPGVAPELLPQLFDRFFRVEGSRDRARGGAGLGLSICRNIVEAHGGSITALPAPLGGVLMRIELPLGER